MNYSNVQFISWEINSGPKITSNSAPVSPQDLTGYYPGFCNANDNRLDVLSQCQDIEARVNFTKAAIKAAQQSSNLDKNSSTLKVFMAPEFLYRGAGGAYLHDLLNGWVGPAPVDFGLGATQYASKWPGLFGSLQSFVSDDTFKDWVFVFGTAISASFATFLDSSSGKAYIDTSKPAETYNSALIQLGGRSNTNVNYASRKHYVSAIDFLKYYFYTNAAFLKDHVVPLDANTIQYVVETAPEGAALFHLSGVNDGTGRPIDFGLEVCLDHAVSGGMNPTTHSYNNDFGRIRNANKYVKIQLVPSAGMSLEDASIRLEPAGNAPTPNSYAFNCDGLRSGTQIWNGANGTPVPPQNKLFEANNGARLANTTVSQLGSTVVTTFKNDLPATLLWTNGAGSVRVMNSLRL